MPHSTLIMLHSPFSGPANAKPIGTIIPCPDVATGWSAGILGVTAQSGTSTGDLGSSIQDLLDAITGVSPNNLLSYLFNQAG